MGINNDINELINEVEIANKYLGAFAVGGVFLGFTATALIAAGIYGIIRYINSIGYLKYLISRYNKILDTTYDSKITDKYTDKIKVCEHKLNHKYKELEQKKLDIEKENNRLAKHLSNPHLSIKSKQDIKEKLNLRERIISKLRSFK